MANTTVAAASPESVQVLSDKLDALTARVTALEGGTVPPQPPVADYTLVVDKPATHTTLTGVTQFAGMAPAMKNVELWDEKSTVLFATTPDSAGKWSGSVDTNKYVDDSVVWKVCAWDVPAGQMPNHSVEVEMSFVLQNGNAPHNGRSYLLGYYGVPPEGEQADFTLNGSFQTHSAGGGVYLASPTFPVVIDIDGGQYDMTYSDIAAGKHDNDINKTLNSIPANAHQAIYAFRIDREFNLYNNWLNATPQVHRDAMNHLCDLIRAKFPNVPIIWNPNALNGGDVSDRTPEKCDMIGVDAYANPTWNNTADKLLGDPNSPGWGTLHWWAGVARAKGKLLALPEWGDDYADGVFIHAVADFVDDLNNKVALISYWNSNDGEPAMLRGASLDAFLQRFGGRQYSGNYWTLKPTDHSIPGY
jgi:hypothetical protein